MKTINTYINEKLRLTTKQKYTCQPKDKNMLRSIIIDRIEDEGPNCDLNDIDVSKIIDMTGLFNKPIFKDFNGDISQWNVSNVTNMDSMFYKCKAFDGDISMWDVSNVKNMSAIFAECASFNCDLSKWDVSNVENMRWMFYMCGKFNQNLNSWNVSNVEDMRWMFNGCKKFTQDLNSWDVSNSTNTLGAFKDCPAPQPKWYK